MSTAKIALGVAAGYLLGRRKKMRLAVAVGGLLAGQRIATNPAGMLRQANELIDKNPDLADLKQRVTGELYDSARSAALASATSSVESLNESLTSRRAPAADEDGEESEDPPAEEKAAKTGPVQKPSASKSSGSTSSAAKKTSSTKKAPAKKSSASKSTAKKSTAKKTPAKKSTSGSSRSDSGS